MKQCGDYEHKIYSQYNIETGLPLVGEYPCLICSYRVIILDNDGTFRVEPTLQDGRCGKCGKPIDEHNNGGTSCPKR